MKICIQNAVPGLSGTPESGALGSSTQSPEINSNNTDFLHPIGKTAKHPCWE